VNEEFTSLLGGRGMAERDFSYLFLLEILGELEISLNTPEIELYFY